MNDYGRDKIKKDLGVDPPVKRGLVWTLPLIIAASWLAISGIVYLVVTFLR